VDAFTYKIEVLIHLL